MPAARPDVIHEKNADRIKAQFVIPGANIAVTPEAEEILHKKGIICLPDFIVNAGGVICAAMEYRGSSESAVFQVIEEKKRYNTDEILKNADRESILPRQAADRMAYERLRLAMSIRRYNIF